MLRTIQGMNLSRQTQDVINNMREEKMEGQVEKILRMNRTIPLTEDWYKVRNKYLTASDMAGVLGNNYFSSFDDVLKKKKRCITGERPAFSGNRYTRWGQKYETEAAVLYSKVTGLELVEEEIGFMVHPVHQRLGATPDFITKSGIVVEIKCPYKRKIGSYIPKQYMDQVQFQLEVTGLDTAHFVQYYPEIKEMVDGKPPRWEGYPLRPKKGTLEIVEVKRDPLWWKNSLPVFNHFLGVLDGKKNGLMMRTEEFDIV